MKPEWLPCPSFPGYSASSDGRVFSHRGRRGVPGQRGGSVVVLTEEPRREMSQHINKKGYRLVAVSVDGRSRPHQVAALVLDAFVGPRPLGAVCRHLDGDPANNSLDNLAYGSHLDNAMDRVRHGRYPRGGAHPGARLTDAQARDVRSLREQGVRVRTLSEDFGVSVSTIESIIYGKAY